MVLPVSRRVPRVPRYLGTERGSLSPFAYGAFTLYRGSFQDPSARKSVSYSPASLQRRPVRPCHPAATTLAGLHNDGLGCSLFARRYWGNRDCFLFLRVLRWFTSPGWLRLPMCSEDALEECPRGVAPFGNLRVKACLAARRSLSQLATSFFAVLRQGIHRTPLVA